MASRRDTSRRHEATGEMRMASEAGLRCSGRAGYMQDVRDEKSYQEILESCHCPDNLWENSPAQHIQPITREALDQPAGWERGEK